MKDIAGNPLHLKSLNHISLVCRSVEESIDFYTNVLGFVPIRRPGSFDFDGAWLFSYGIGIHLLQSENPDNMAKKTEINPKDNHISFQCESMGTVEKKLKEMEIVYKRQRVEEGGIYVDQLFFHDPDGFMIKTELRPKNTPFFVTSNSRIVFINSMAETEPKPKGSLSENDVKSPNILERAKEEIKAVFKDDKSPRHDKETHGRNDDIDERTSVEEVKAPSVFGRMKEEIEAVVEAIHPKKESDTKDSPSK